MLLPLALATLCLSCDEPAQSTGPRLGVPAPTIELGAEGCARFQVRFQQGNTPVIEETYNSSGCPAQELKLFSDTAATFDAATGALRIAIRVKNEGTTTVIPRLRLRFHADSAQRFNANGQPLGGVSDILGYQPDSTSLAGRIAFWFYDTYMAPAGQPQVLPPGATSQRRWVEFRGTTWSPHVRLKLVVAGQEVGTVPAVPPDTLPTNFYHDTNVVSRPALAPYRFVKDVVIIAFKPTTSNAQRAAVVGGLGGIVVGGYRSGPDGAYVVRLPRDTSHQTIFSAVDALNANPLVGGALIEFVFDGITAHDRSQDSQGWTRSDYLLSPDSGFSPAALRSTSALTAIAAPFVWGCSVGDSTIRVSVIDAGLNTTGMTDLTKNLRYSSGINLPNVSDRHGTSVAMVLAARGNDTLQMSGVARRAALSLRDATLLNNGIPVVNNGKLSSSNLSVASHIDSAIVDGERVINISLGIDTLRTGVAGAADYKFGAQFGHFVKNLLAMRAPVDTPLFVISAGNNSGADPAFSYFPVLKDSVPSHALVVAAAARVPGTVLYSPPAQSTVVPDLAAPGEAVGTMTGPTSYATLSGTSFAAPLVSGSAVLLLAFDARLRAREVKDLLIQGAALGTRTAGQFPVLNAYESLKKAAERPGAPLCGNRVWTDGANLSVRRGTGVEVIATQTPVATTMGTYHGGRVVAHDVKPFVWQPNGSWQLAQTLPSALVPSGAWRSSIGTSHEGDSTVFTSIAPAPSGGGAYFVTVDHYAGSTLLSSTTATSGFSGLNEPVLAFVAHPTVGNRALVSVAKGPQVQIPVPPAAALSSGTVYSLDLATKQVTTLWTETGRGVLWTGYSEDGSEIVAAVTQAYSGFGRPLVAIPSCKVTWRKVTAPAVVIDSALAPHACALDPIAGERGGGSAARFLPHRSP